MSHYLTSKSTSLHYPYFYCKSKLYFTINSRHEDFKDILRSLRNPVDLEKRYDEIMEMIKADGKDMLLREPNLLKFMVKKAPLLIASSSYANVMQVRHLFDYTM